MSDPVFTSPEEYARGIKVAAIVDALDAAGADLSYVQTMGPGEWATAARAAGVKHPGAKTKEIVLAVFQRRAGAAR